MYTYVKSYAFIIEKVLLKTFLEQWFTTGVLGGVKIHRNKSENNFANRHPLV